MPQTLRNAGDNRARASRSICCRAAPPLRDRAGRARATGWPDTRSSCGRRRRAGRRSEAAPARASTAPSGAPSLSAASASSPEKYPASSTRSIRYCGDHPLDRVGEAERHLLGQVPGKRRLRRHEGFEIVLAIADGRRDRPRTIPKARQEPPPAGDRRLHRRERLAQDRCPAGSIGLLAAASQIVVLQSADPPRYLAPRADGGRAGRRRRSRSSTGRSRSGLRSNSPST